MRPWAVLASISVGASLALLFVQCGGDGSATGSDDLALPDRVDSIDTGIVDGAFTVDSSTTTPAPACDPTKPFASPVRLAEFDATTTRATPRLSADELTLYFTTLTDAGGIDLAMATRASKTAPFAGESILPQSGPSNDHDPAVGADDLTLWFHSGRNGTADIFLSTRTSSAGEFGAAAPIALNSDASNENHAYFRAAASELWFISDRPGSAGYDIYRSTRDGSAFATPSRMSELASDASDYQPQPSEDGLTVLFSSDREGGMGSIDLWLARRASVSAPFGAPVPLTELNSATTEQAGWLSADGCRIWFSSGRETNDVNQQLFFAERPK
jgi:Tol biopolymer transport system component